MTRFSISTWLGALILAIFLPLFAFVVLLLGQLQASDNAKVEQRTVREAASIAQAIKPVIDSMLITVNLVSSMEELSQGDLEGFHRRSRFALRGSGNYIIVTDKNGQQLLNTRVDFGTELGLVADMDGIENAMASSMPYVSNVLLGRTGGKWAFNVLKALPNFTTSEAHVVVTTKNTEDLAPVIDRLVLAPGWTAAVVDDHGRIVVASSERGLNTGDALVLPMGLLPSDFSGTSRFRRFSDAEGNILGYAPIIGTQWATFVWGPADAAQASLLQSWQILIWGGLIFLLLSLAILYLFTRFLKKTVYNVAQMAERLGEGEIVSPIDSRISEIDRVAKALSNASFDRSQREETITFVMKELAHRTKNLIAVVISIVRQTAKRNADPQQMAKSITSRIMGLGASIDSLTAREWASVPLRELVESQLAHFGATGGNIKVKGPDIDLRPDAVQHMGMALHELATNAAKHGGLSTSAGRVEVSWTVETSDTGQQLRLQWLESGGPAVVEPEIKGFGAQILERHVAATFNGQASTEYLQTGLRWVLTAPLQQFEVPTKPGASRKPV
ncbi:sensor histidine kinase [Hoeflea sp. G2-23]|uniref:histidine kinase n=1 Tax=Hoeflea algicola TaxID=2983763 RepID=A0ABT3Z4I9_9HYPH|nr:sensor histidine kinase [Hoeflea algicola]MCY0146679.1 sensor histidine kinase [Hoeflea algicola]